MTGLAAAAGVSASVSLGASAPGAPAASAAATRAAAAIRTPVVSTPPAVITGQGARQDGPAPRAGHLAATTPAAGSAVRVARHGTALVKRAPSTVPYLVYDSVLPQDIPAGQEVATYADGPPSVSPAAVEGRSRVLWIDVNGTDTAAQVIDVEPGCATPPVAASWAYRKLSAQPQADAIIYTSIAEWALVKADVSGLPAAMQARIRWWIADPTGVPHVVPGSQATQWYWGPEYDISTATAQF